MIAPRLNASVGATIAGMLRLLTSVEPTPKLFLVAFVHIILLFKSIHNLISSFLFLSESSRLFWFPRELDRVLASLLRNTLSTVISHHRQFSLSSTSESSSL